MLYNPNFLAHRGSLLEYIDSFNFVSYKILPWDLYCQVTGV